MITASRALAEKSGDSQARAELLTEMLTAAKMKVYTLQYGSRRSFRCLTVLQAEDSHLQELESALKEKPKAFTIGSDKYLSLPLNGDKIGELPTKIFDKTKQSFTETIILLPH